MELREKKSHLFGMAKFFQQLKDKKEMLFFLKKIKDLDRLEEEKLTVGKHNVGESVIKIDPTVGISIELEQDIVVVNNKKKKLK